MAVFFLLLSSLAMAIPSGFALPNNQTALPFALTKSISTVPAFIWSPHYSTDISNDQSVIYQTVSAKELPNSILSRAGWSDFLCGSQKLHQSLDVALVFVGSELQSTDIAGKKRSDSNLVNLLKDYFTRSKSSLAFPYVSTSDEKETMEKSLISGFMESCGRDTRNVAFSESCSVEGENFQKLADLQSVHDHLVSRKEKTVNGQADLVVVCHDSSLSELDQHRPEGEIISELISSVEQSEAKYAVLYVSDPLKSIQYPSYRDLARFLAEGNVSSTGCDEVCQFKSSLIEGIFVALVLLLILISGLCCMMGIDTPTRFETPQE
jgi:hypothetical protein